MKGDFSLPAWNDTEIIPRKFRKWFNDNARKFRKWFNDNARKKWNDNKKSFLASYL